MHLKTLERAWRRMCVRALTALLRRRRLPGAPAWGERPHRVLFLRHDRVGDMILSTGVIRAIATAWPTITLDVLASVINAPVLRGSPYVARVVTFDRKKPWTFPVLVWRMRRGRYDAVVDCMVTAPSLTTLLLMIASGARHRVGVAHRGSDGAFTVSVPPRPDAVHIVDHLSALTAAFGRDPAGAVLRPVIALSDSERSWAEMRWAGGGGGGGIPPIRILVNVSAGRAFRRWPDERFVAVLRHLLDRFPGGRALVIGAPAEWERAVAIGHAGGATAVQTPSLRDALALVATADFVFTPDTSIAHAATAFATPAVAMYVRGTAPVWGLYHSPGRTVSSADGTLVSLPVGPVLRAINEVAPAVVARAMPAGERAARGDDAAVGSDRGPDPLLAR